MKWYVFRHGETFYTRDGVNYGDKQLTISILDEGVPALMRMGEYLKKENISEWYSSPFKRCVDSMKVVKEVAGGGYKTDERMGEFYKKDWGQFVEGIREFLGEIEKKGIEKVGVCTHGAVLAGIRHLLIEGVFEREQMHEHPDPGVLWIIEKGKLEKISFR